MLTSVFPRILLVEGDAPLAAALSAALSAHHLTVDRCESELSAIPMITSSEYNAIIVDVNLVGRVGLSLLAHLHKALPHIIQRLIVITANDRNDVEAELKAIGICDVVPKPIDLQLIVDTVLGCLDTAAATVN
jgi:two-component system OmpR family response regulator